MDYGEAERRFPTIAAKRLITPHSGPEYIRAVNLMNLKREIRLGYRALERALPLLRSYAQAEAVPVERKIGRLHKKIDVVPAWIILPDPPDGKTYPNPAYVVTEDACAGWVDMDRTTEGVFIGRQGPNFYRTPQPISEEDIWLGRMAVNTGQPNGIDGQRVVRELQAIMQKVGVTFTP